MLFSTDRGLTPTGGGLYLLRIASCESMLIRASARFRTKILLYITLYGTTIMFLKALDIVVIIITLGFKFGGKEDGA